MVLTRYLQYMQRIIKIVLVMMALGTVYSVSAQNDGMFKQKKERKRLWRRWSDKERHNKTAYNPYLEKTAKQKPSSRISKGEKKEMRKQRRDYRRQIRKGQKKTQE